MTRLLACSVLIALCSIAATAWLAVHSTTTAIQQQQGQVVADDASIYDTLQGYAATHPDWSQVAGTVRELAARTGRRIALTTPDHQPLADSAPVPSPLPARSSAVLDPLRTDPALAATSQGPQAPAADSDGIDPRAVGPYLLPAADRDQLHTIAQKIGTCLTSHGVSFTTTDQPSGRPAVALASQDGLLRARPPTTAAWPRWPGPHPPNSKP